MTNEADESITYFIAVSWLKAFNSRDLEGILRLYHRDARHYSPKLKFRQPETKGLIIGTDAMRLWWQDAFDRLPNLRYDVKTITASGERVFMEYERVVPGEETMNVAEVLDVFEGLIVASRVYHG